MSDVEDICAQVIEASSNIDVWNPGPYVELIQYKARRTPAAQSFLNIGLPDGNPGDLPIGPIFEMASLDVRHSLERLVLEEVARATFTLGNDFQSRFDKVRTLYNLGSIDMGTTMESRRCKSTDIHINRLLRTRFMDV